MVWDTSKTNESYSSPASKRTPADQKRGTPVTLKASAEALDAVVEALDGAVVVAIKEPPDTVPDGAGVGAGVVMVLESKAN